jgi:hypothetical protein
MESRLAVFYSTTGRTSGMVNRHEMAGRSKGILDCAVSRSFNNIAALITRKANVIGRSIDPSLERKKRRSFEPQPLFKKRF